jgi:hypothetical protein
MKVFLTLFLFFTVNSLLAQQDTSKTYRIILNNGTEILGTVIQMQDSVVIVEANDIGQITLLKKNIKSMEKISEANFKDGTYWFPNPNATRYLIGPSAIPLKAGEGYYQNTYLLLNSFNFGATDFLSFGCGFELITTFAQGNPAFYFTPKVSFKAATNFYLGGGLLYASIPNGDDDRDKVGIAYGIGTYGTDNSNVTVGVGYGFTNGDFSQSPFITFSGMIRTSKKLALVSENWLIPSSEETYDSYGNIISTTTTYPAYISYGLRFFGEKLSVDLAFINSGEIVNSIGIGIPFVDFVVKF